MTPRRPVLCIVTAIACTLNTQATWAGCTCQGPDVMQFYVTSKTYEGSLYGWKYYLYGNYFVSCSASEDWPSCNSRHVLHLYRDGTYINNSQGTEQLMPCNNWWVVQVNMSVSGLWSGSTYEVHFIAYCDHGGEQDEDSIIFVAGEDPEE